MPSQHKHPPISLRLPEADRAWLLGYAEHTGIPVNRILADALTMFRVALAVDREFLGDLDGWKPTGLRAGLVQHGEPEQPCPECDGEGPYILTCSACSGTGVV